jgi:hypothetical protein
MACTRSAGCFLALLAAGKREGLRGGRLMEGVKGEVSQDLINRGLNRALVVCRVRVAVHCWNANYNRGHIIHTCT